jgi:nucleoside-diphosphate-sugar epimerase
MSSKVLVTGGSGYLGTQLITALLRGGREVRATVRSLDGEAGVVAAVRHGGADDTGLELVAADLTSDDGWPAALEGVEEVHHVASPIPSAQPKDPDELIVPARQGTVRVLKAARDAGARRVVLTSLFAAVGYCRRQSATTPRQTGPTPIRQGCRPTRVPRRSPSVLPGTS